MFGQWTLNTVSYHNNAQCIISTIVDYYWYVYYCRYVRIICQHDRARVCVALRVCGSNSVLSGGCVSSAKIMISLFVTSR